MSDASTPTTEVTMDSAESRPIPVRYWWLKRILVACGVLIIGLVALRVWWGWEAHRRLQAQIDEYIAAGEPIYPEDFDQEPVPDEENAAKMLDDAAAALSITAEQKLMIGDVLDDFGVVKTNMDQLKQLVEDNTEALRLVRTARHAPAMNWGIQLRSPMTSVNLPSLSPHRELSQLLPVAAAYFHAIGDDAESTRTIRDALAHSDAIGNQSTLIAYLTALPTCALQLESIEAIAPRLQLDAHSADLNQPSKAAQLSDVKAIISDLLEVDAIDATFVRVMFTLRAEQLDLASMHLQGQASLATISGWGGVVRPTLYERVLVLPIRPFRELDLLFMLRYTTSFVRAVGAETHMEGMAQSETHPFDYRASTLRMLRYALSHEILPGLGRALTLHFRSRAKRQMAGIALAIRLHELDHGGRPSVLADLVPKYVPRLPVDPFGDGKATLVYRPDADPPVLYSIGSNGADDGGVALWPWEKGDIPFYLNGVRPERIDFDVYRAAQSRKAADDNQNSKDTEGKTEEDQPAQQRP